MVGWVIVNLLLNEKLLDKVVIFVDLLEFRIYKFSYYILFYLDEVNNFEKIIECVGSLCFKLLMFKW